MVAAWQWRPGTQAPAEHGRAEPPGRLAGASDPAWRGWPGVSAGDPLAGPGIVTRIERVSCICKLVLYNEVYNIWNLGSCYIACTGAI